MREETLGREETTARVLAGGLCTLVVAVGIGRFAFTPILPDLQREAGLGADAAGLLAALNYAGYLGGALAAGWVPPGAGRTLLFRLALAAGIATTGLMAATALVGAWGGLRLVSGLASGALFVISADMVIRRLTTDGRARLAGIHFSGVGLGIALTGILVPVLGAAGGWRAEWAGLAATSVVFAVPALLWLADGRGLAGAGVAGAGAAGAGVADVATGPAVPGPMPTAAAFPLAVLVIAYFLEGFGYVVSGTFLVAILEAGARESGVESVGALSWTVVGLAAAPSGVLFPLAAARWGAVRVLVAGHLAQAVGIVLPVFSTALLPAVVAAVLLGSTLVGITALAVGFGRQIARGAPARAIGLLTGAFGLGQVLGPVIGGWLAARSGSFDGALVVAAVAVAAGGGLLAAAGVAIRWSAARNRSGV